MKSSKPFAVTDPTPQHYIVALEQAQRPLLARIDALDSRLAGMESDLALFRVLLLERFHIDPQYVAKRLGLTPAQSRLAVALAEGNTMRSIAKKTGRAESTLQHHLKKIYRRLDISRQSELVRLTLLLPYRTGTAAESDAETPLCRDPAPGR